MDDVRSLIISTELPAAPMTGGRIRTHHLARALSRLGPVTVAAFTLDGESPAVEAPLTTETVPWSPPPLYAQMASADAETAERAYAQLARAGAEPWIASCYESAPLRDTIRGLCEDRVDVVMVEHSLMASYLDAVRPGVCSVLDLHNVHSREAERAARRGQEHASEVQRVRRFEAAAIQRSTLTLTVSAAEALAARELVPGARVEVVPNGVDLDHFTPGAVDTVPGFMLFAGLMNYGPNVEGVQWFSRAVMPLLDGGVLHVVGARPSKEVRELSSERIVVHGEVADTRPSQRQAQVVVVPLLSGAGTRLKILEAAACGNAIVSTSLGAEGLEFVDGRDLLLADTSREFANAVDAVLHDDGLRARIGQSARRAATSYGWELIGERLLALVEPLVGVHAT